MRFFQFLTLGALTLSTPAWAQITPHTNTSGNPGSVIAADQPSTGFATKARLEVTAGFGGYSYTRAHFTGAFGLGIDGLELVLDYKVRAVKISSQQLNDPLSRLLRESTGSAPGLNGDPSFAYGDPTFAVRYLREIASGISAGGEAGVLVVGKTVEFGGPAESGFGPFGRLIASYRADLLGVPLDIDLNAGYLASTNLAIVKSSCGDTSTMGLVCDRDNYFDDYAGRFLLDLGGPLQDGTSFQSQLLLGLSLGTSLMGDRLRPRIEFSAQPYLAVNAPGIRITSGAAFDIIPKRATIIAALNWYPDAKNHFQPVGSSLGFFIGFQAQAFPFVDRPRLARATITLGGNSGNVGDNTEQKHYWLRIRDENGMVKNTRVSVFVRTRSGQEGRLELRTNDTGKAFLRHPRLKFKKGTLLRVEVAGHSVSPSDTIDRSTQNFTHRIKYAIKSGNLNIRVQTTRTARSADAIVRITNIKETAFRMLEKEIRWWLAPSNNPENRRVIRDKLTFRWADGILLVTVPNIAPGSWRIGVDMERRLGIFQSNGAFKVSSSGDFEQNNYYLSYSVARSLPAKPLGIRALSGSKYGGFAWATAVKLTFEPDLPSLTSAAKRQLDIVKAYRRKHDPLLIEQGTELYVGWSPDPNAPPALADAIGAARAEAVKEYLTRNGWQPSAVKIRKNFSVKTNVRVSILFYRWNE